MAAAAGGETARAHLAHPGMLLYAFLVSTSFTVGGAITQGLDPIVLTFLRFAVASLVFGAVLRTRGPIARPALADLPRYGIISLTMVLFFVLMFEALRHTDPLSTGAIFTLVPLATAGIAFLLLGEKCRRQALGALLVGGLGALWVLFDGRIDALLEFDLGYGEALFALGALSFAAYSPAVRRLHRGASLMVLNFWVLIAGTVMLGLYGAPRIIAVDWGEVPAIVFLGIAYLGTFNTAVTFSIAKFASTVLTPYRVMAYTYLIPSFVVLQEGAFGYGWPPLAVFGGIALTIAAMLILQLQGRARVPAGNVP